MPGIWHTGLQDFVTDGVKDHQEVRFDFKHGDANHASSKRHRFADAVIADKVVDVQHSRIKRDVVNQRNEDYQNKDNQVVWILNMTDAQAPVKRPWQDGHAWFLDFPNRKLLDPFTLKKN
jgi:hypothetical protein